MINTEEFRLKSTPVVAAYKHHKDCLVMEDGPCTCGLEEVLEDEMQEDLESFEKA